MGLVPEFSDSDSRELRNLGVSDAQIRHLRHALVHVRRVTSDRPKRKETIDLLADIERMSGELSRKLVMLVLQPAPEYSYVHQLIEESYWNEPGRESDNGPTSSHHIAPRLETLSKAAKIARENLPSGQTRQTRADPRAIRWIADALLHGWLEDNPHDEQRALPPYPEAFHVSKATGSPFRKIAGICYGTVGGNGDPLRAIETFLKLRREENASFWAAMEDAWKT